MVTKTIFKVTNIIKKSKKKSIHDIATQLSINKEKVFESIDHLIEIGLQCETNNGFLHCHNDWIDDKKILTQLKCRENICIKIKTFTRSTNEYLLAKKSQKLSYEALIAEYQSQGRGQLEKKWLSPMASALYLSIRFTPKRKLNPDFSYAIALCLIDALKDYGIHKTIEIKRPNDLLYQGKKFAGILIEGTYHHPNQYWVIGIGMNCNMTHLIPTAIDQEWTDLATITKKPIDRNRLAANVIDRIVTMLEGNP